MHVLDTLHLGPQSAATGSAQRVDAGEACGAAASAPPHVQGRHLAPASGLAASCRPPKHHGRGLVRRDLRLLLLPYKDATDALGPAHLPLGRRPRGQPHPRPIPGRPWGTLQLGLRPSLRRHPRRNRGGKGRCNLDAVDATPSCRGGGRVGLRDLFFVG